MIIYPIRIVSTQNTDVLEIRWMPHNLCNFQCRYCFPGSFEGDEREPEDLDLVINNFHHFINYYKTQGKTKIHLKILGGEPTLWKGLEKFILAMKSQHNVYITLISNGSRNLKWWQDYGHLIDNIILSFHVARGDISHHIAVADTMFALKKKVTVLVLMDPTIWSQCRAAVEYMKSHSKYQWFIQAKELIKWNLQAQIDYTLEQKQYLSKELKRRPSIFWFVKNFKLVFDGTIRLWESRARLNNGKTIRATAQTYINNGWTNFQGWQCGVGLDAVFIGVKGDVSGSCTVPVFGKVIPNILSLTFIQDFNPGPIVPVICPKTTCDCQPETHITKFKV